MNVSLNYEKKATDLGVMIHKSKNPLFKFDIYDYHNQLLCSIGDIMLTDYFQALVFDEEMALSIQYEYFKHFDRKEYLKYERYYYEYNILFNLAE